MTTDNFAILSSDRLWKNNLNSNFGAFKKLGVDPHVSGPRVSASGNIVGDTLSIETTLFSQKASEDQQNLLEYLAATNPVKMREYILTLIGAIPVWKNDLIILEEFLKKLQDGKHLVETEEEQVARDGMQKIARLKLLLGDLFTLEEQNKMAHDLSAFIEDLKREDARVSLIIHNISEHLNYLRLNFSFLFV